MATFITSKVVGEFISINLETTTGWWKYNHNGTDSEVFAQEYGSQSVEVLNVNGEFTLISCDFEGTPNGNENILTIVSVENQLTSFDGTALTGLTTLNLSSNQLTSLDGFILPTSLTSLNLYNNQLTSFDGTGLTSLTSLNSLDLSSNQLTSLSRYILPTSLTQLFLSGNQLTLVDVSSLTNLTTLNLVNNLISSSTWDSILADLAGFNNEGGNLSVGNVERTSTSDGDYQQLVGVLNWTVLGSFTLAPTLEEQVELLSEDVDNLRRIGGEYEKELAILKGRTDGAETRIGEMEANQNRVFQTGMLIIDEYDILTGTITKTAKNTQGNFFARFYRHSTDDKAIFLSQRSGVLFTENNTSGIWPTVNVYSTDATSVTGKDIIVGAPAFDGDNFYSGGQLPTLRGGYLTITKQDV